MNALQLDQLKHSQALAVVHRSFHTQYGEPFCIHHLRRKIHNLAFRVARQSRASIHPSSARNAKSPSAFDRLGCL